MMKRKCVIHETPQKLYRKQEKNNLFQFYKYLIWASIRGRALRQEEHGLIAVLLPQSEVVLSLPTA